MKNSKIEWCDHTFNPWVGCTKCSPGCCHCYAAERAKRFGLGEYKKGVPRVRTSAKNWGKVLAWADEAANQEIDRELENPHGNFLKGYQRPRVFCASLADWLDDEVPAFWLSDLLYLIGKCRALDFLLLTKRPELWRSRLQEVKKLGDCGAQVAAAWLDGKPLPNIWLGTTVEDQQRADERIPALLSIPAKVRFLSCEPLLGPVDLQRTNDGVFAWSPLTGRHIPAFVATEPHAKIDWVICGGESGPHARPMHPDWARSLRDQCQAAGVPFLFKQWGEWYSVKYAGPKARITHIEVNGRKCSRYHDWEDGHFALPLGKHDSGRLLDGEEHNQFPEVAS